MLQEFPVDATGRRRFAQSTAAPGFADLQAHAVELARVAVRNGRFTERGLARAMFISQSHAHNILAGRRGCTAEMADALLEQLGLTVWDLLEEQNRTCLVLPVVLREVGRACRTAA